MHESQCISQTDALLDKIRKYDGPVPLSEDRPININPCDTIRLRSRDGRLQDVGRLRSFGSLHDVEFDILAFLQRLEPVALQGGIVDEDIFPTIEPDKSEPLPIIEPLHGTFSLHKPPPFLNDHAQLRSRPNKPYMETYEWERDTNVAGVTDGHLQDG